MSIEPADLYEQAASVQLYGLALAVLVAGRKGPVVIKKVKADKLAGLALRAEVAPDGQSMTLTLIPSSDGQRPGVIYNFVEEPQP